MPDGFSQNGFGEVVETDSAVGVTVDESGFGAGEVITDDVDLDVSPGSGFEFVEIANFTVALAIIFAAGLSVIYVFVGGINFILSGGSEEKIKKAVHTIRYAVIGLLVTIFAVTIIAILGSILNFDLISYLSWEKIMKMMGIVIGRLTKTDLPGPGLE